MTFNCYVYSVLQVQYKVYHEMCGLWWVAEDCSVVITHRSNRIPKWSFQTIIFFTMIVIIEYDFSKTNYVFGLVYDGTGETKMYVSAEVNKNKIENSFFKYKFKLTIQA